MNAQTELDALRIRLRDALGLDPNPYTVFTDAQLIENVITTERNRKKAYDDVERFCVLYDGDRTRVATALGLNKPHLVAHEKVIQTISKLVAPAVVRWIVCEGEPGEEGGEEGEGGELGVEVNGKAYTYYKDHEPCPHDGLYRNVRKREFGEVIRPTHPSIERPES